MLFNFLIVRNPIKCTVLIIDDKLYLINNRFSKELLHENESIRIFSFPHTLRIFHSIDSLLKQLL